MERPVHSTIMLMSTLLASREPSLEKELANILVRFTLSSKYFFHFKSRGFASALILTYRQGKVSKMA